MTIIARATKSSGKVIASVTAGEIWNSTHRLPGTMKSEPSTYMLPGPISMRMFSTSEVKRLTMSPERLRTWKASERRVSLSNSSCLSSTSTRRETLTIHQRARYRNRPCTAATPSSQTKRCFRKAGSSLASRRVSASPIHSVRRMSHNDASGMQAMPSSRARR